MPWFASVLADFRVLRLYFLGGTADTRGMATNASKSRKSSKKSAPKCVFCHRSSGVQFAIFNPRFQPFGTACVEYEKSLPPGTVVPSHDAQAQEVRS